MLLEVLLNAMNWSIRKVEVECFNLDQLDRCMRLFKNFSKFTTTCHTVTVSHKLNKNGTVTTCHHHWPPGSTTTGSKGQKDNKITASSTTTADAFRTLWYVLFIFKKKSFTTTLMVIYTTTTTSSKLNRLRLGVATTT